jgi:anti-sigma regulatory factor (Ser/Thr protein kinase)
MAATEARHAVTACFEPVLGEETLDDVLLVVSELVTNALLHGHGEIGLRMALEAQQVTGVVTDEGAAFDTTPPNRDPTRIGGHGLFIVGRVSERWGVGDDAAHVWFEIAAAR